jgi:uncharacterized protein (TIGR00251 family)
MACYRLERDAIVVNVRLTPGADRDAVEGVGVLADGREVVHARVRAHAEDGAANAAMVKLFSRTFRRPKSVIDIVSGAGARLKTVRISGEPAALAAVAATWVPKT